MSTRIKFKEREETKGISLFYVKLDEPLEAFEFRVKRIGWFSVGYHYIIHKNGAVEEGVDHTQYADPSINGYRDHVCVLIMGQVQGKMNDFQRKALEALAEDLKLEVVQ